MMYYDIIKNYADIFIIQTYYLILSVLYHSFISSSILFSRKVTTFSRSLQIIPRNFFHLLQKLKNKVQQTPAFN